MTKKKSKIFKGQIFKGDSLLRTEISQVLRHTNSLKKAFKNTRNEKKKIANFKS